MNSQKSMTKKRKIRIGFMTLVILILSFAITTYALVIASVSVEDNAFTMGILDINFNDDEPVIKPAEFIFEPGMTVEKDFFIENEGTIDAYYRLYFDNVEGAVADVLEITVKEAENVLYVGKAAEMTRENACMSENALGSGEKVWLTAVFYYPEGEGNDTQKQFMTFDICTDAVQTKNNPDRLFE